MIVDGHSSRLNPSLLLHCICNDLVMLNLPSHLTHILQPNDAGVNKLMKDLLDELLVQHLEAKLPITPTILDTLIVNTLMNPRMKSCIIKSYAHCGIWPIDCSRGARNLADESPAQAVQRDEVALHAAELAKKHVNKLIALQEASKRTNSAALRVNSRRRLFSQGRVTSISRSTQMSRMKLDIEWTEIRLLKAEKLRQHMIAVGYERSSLMKEDGKSFKKMEVLQGMERARLESLVDVVGDRLDVVRAERYERDRLPGVMELLGTPEDETLEEGTLTEMVVDPITLPTRYLDLLDDDTWQSAIPVPGPRFEP